MVPFTAAIKEGAAVVEDGQKGIRLLGKVQSHARGSTAAQPFPVGPGWPQNPLLPEFRLSRSSWKDTFLYM